MRLSFVRLALACLLGAAVGVNAQAPSNRKDSEGEPSDVKTTKRKKTTPYAPNSPHKRQSHHGDLWDDTDEPPRSRRWFPLTFLGLPLEGTIAEGSQGFDAAFGTLHGVAEPVKYSKVPKGVQTQDAPANQETPLPQEVTVKQWEIIASDGKLTDSNGSVCHYVWRFVLRNNSDVEMAVSGEVDFVDADNHTVDGAKVTVVRIAPHAEQEFTGSKMMMVESAQAILKPMARFSEM